MIKWLPNWHKVEYEVNDGLCLTECPNDVEDEHGVKYVGSCQCANCKWFVDDIEDEQYVVCGYVKEIVR